MDKYLMGIDNGGTVSKVGIYDLKGNEIVVSGSNSELLSPIPGRYERNLNQIWSANVNAIKEALNKSNIKGEQIAGIAITGHGNGINLIDKYGNPTYNAIESSDARAAGYVKKWMSDGTFKKVFPKTTQSLWPGSAAVLLAWFKDNEHEVIKKTRWVLMIKDYIRYKLTGEVFAEITDISGANLLNNIDECYDDDLLKSFGIDDLREKLPPLKQSADICGYITKEAAILTGLKEGTPVAGGMFDVDATGIACGINDDTKLNLVVGTWCNNQYISRIPVVSKEVFMTSLYSIPGYWLVLEGSPTSASNLQWFVDNFMQEEKKIAKQRGRTVYDICNESVERTKADETDIVFLPFLYGSNAGLDAKAVFLGLEGWNSREHVIRAIFEGIIFSHKTHIDKLLKYRKMPDVIRIAGGAVRSNVWMQMFADILEIPIEITMATELGTLGAAMCAGVAVNEFSGFNDAISRMIKVMKKIIPDSNLHGVYQKKYQNYKRAIKTLSNYWD